MLIHQLTPVCILLKLSGFLLPPKRIDNFFIRWLFHSYAYSLITINFVLFGYNVIAIDYFRKVFGLMNEKTISLLIQGLKPLHAMVNLTVFVFNRELHKQAKELFEDIDEHFNSSFRYKIKFRFRFVHLILLVALFLLVPFAIRISSVMFLAEKLGTNWVADVSLILVPMLSMWQMLPLYYYYVTTAALTKWFCYLSYKINSKCQSESDQNDNQQILKSYLEIFRKMTKAVFVLDTFFNPFVFFSIGISLTVLCITIYYITALNDLVSTSKGAVYGNSVNTYYFVVWTGLQVLAAVAYLLVICTGGWRTNESARRISSTLISLNPNSMELKILVSDS